MPEFADLGWVDHPVPGQPAAWVRAIELRREAKKNAFSVELSTQLSIAVRQADEDPAVRVVLLSARGDVFSAGADLGLFLGQTPALTGLDPEAIVTPDRVHEVLDACAKPLIAVVGGRAVGMGVTLLPHFDLVYASERASFSCPFVKLGLVLELGSSFSLPRMIGRQRTNELVLRGSPLDAETAERWGLVTRLFPHAELMPRALEIALEIAANPPLGVAKSKRLIRQGEQTPTFAECIRAENEVLQTCYGSAENVAAAMAFFASRQR